jgi:hypothetical protein
MVARPRSYSGIHHEYIALLLLVPHRFGDGAKSLQQVVVAETAVRLAWSRRDKKGGVGLRDGLRNVKGSTKPATGTVDRLLEVWLLDGGLSPSQRSYLVWVHIHTDYIKPPGGKRGGQASA